VVDLKISISFANFVPIKKVSAGLKITISAIKFPSKKTLKTKENNRSRGSGTNGPKTTPPVAGGRPSKLYVKVLILPTEIILAAGEVVLSSRKVVLIEIKAILIEAKIVLIEAKTISTEAETILIEVKVILREVKTILIENKVVLIEVKTVLSSSKMTFPEAEAAFPEAQTTGLPVKNLKNAEKLPLPPATGGGGFLRVARSPRRRRWCFKNRQK